MADESKIGVEKSMDPLAIKVYGELDSEAFREFCRKAEPIDMTVELGPNSTMVPHILYEGEVVTKHFGRGLVEAQKHLILNENDVIVASHPKTGTTWVQEIVYSLIHQDELDKPIAVPIDVRAPELEFPETGFKAMLDMPSPKVLKSHLHYHLLPNGGCDKKYKIVYLTRNPKDTAVSLFYFYKMMAAFRFNSSLKELVDLFLAGKALFGPFDKSVLSYWNQRHLDNVLIVKYEDLQKDVLSEIRRMAEFLKVKVDDAVVDKIAVRCGFDHMAKNPLLNHTQWTDIDKCTDNQNFAFMRKGKVGDWRNQFDEETNRKFDQWIEKSFGNSDITFDYEF